MNNPFDLNFLCIGATKCGTTWLHTVLNEHPEINVSMNKEPCYFSNNYKKGLTWYEKCWRKNNGIKGEFTNHYLYKIKSLDRIKKDFPNIKLIILLRNPRDRAISHYKMIKKDFPYVEDKKLLNSYPKIIERSFYYTYIESVFNRFDKNNIFIGYYEEIIDSPEILVSNIFKFLSVNNKIIPNNLRIIIGDSYTPKYYIIEKIKILVHDVLTYFGMYKFVCILRSLSVIKFIKSFNKDIASSIYIPISNINIYNQSLINDLNKLDKMDKINSKYIRKWISSIEIDQKYR